MRSSRICKWHHDSLPCSRLAGRQNNPANASDIRCALILTIVKDRDVTWAGAIPRAVLVVLNACQVRGKVRGDRIFF